MSTATVSLRISGLDPDLVGSRLGLKPTIAQRKGTPRIGAGGRYSDVRQHVWLYDLEASGSGELAVSLDSLLNVLLEKQTELERLRSQGGEVSVVVGLFIDSTIGFSLTSEALQRWAEADLPVEFHCYSVAEEA